MSEKRLGAHLLSSTEVAVSKTRMDPSRCPRSRAVYTCRQSSSCADERVERPGRASGGGGEACDVGGDARGDVGGDDCGGVGETCGGVGDACGSGALGDSSVGRAASGIGGSLMLVRGGASFTASLERPRSSMSKHPQGRRLACVQLKKVCLWA